jgi:hypothetical protein
VKAKLPTKLSKDRVLGSDVLLVVEQQGVGKLCAKEWCSPEQSKTTQGFAQNMWLSWSW